MKSVCRDSDILARLGGDGFAVLLANTSRIGAESVMERFGESLERYNQEAGRGYAISFAYGVVEFDPRRHQTVEALLADGDAAMYAHKQQLRRLSGHGG